MNRNKTAHQILVTGPLPVFKDVIYSGIRIRVYSIGWLSVISSLANVTLRLWERKGILPKPLFRLANRRRWYTPMELFQYNTLVRSHYQGNRSLLALKQQLHSAQLKAKAYYDSCAKKKDTTHHKLDNEENLMKAIKLTRVAKLSLKSGIEV